MYRLTDTSFNWLTGLFSGERLNQGQSMLQIIYVGRSTTLHNLLFCAHTLCMNYVTNTFLLVTSSVRSKQLLCFVQGQGQKSEE